MVSQQGPQHGLQKEDELHGTVPVTKIFGGNIS
jgi:hypothetical protein